MQVIKRNNQSEDLNVTKIRKVISVATEKFEVDPNQLETQVSIRFYDKITTSAIQENLISTALQLANVNEPEWTNVAAKLYSMNYIKDVEYFRKYDYSSENFSFHVKKMLDDGKYSDQLKIYTDEDLLFFSSFLCIDRDDLYDYAGIVAFSSRYLVKNELYQEAYMVMAMMIASVEDPSIRNDLVIKIYNTISLKKASLATPILSNLRKPNSNLSSCFVASIGDSLDEIYDSVKDIARISKEGGGVGVCLSEIRAKGSWIQGQENRSNGVLPWIKVINDTAIACNQLGTRSGAVTVALDCWHYDLEEFLDVQTEQGDYRLKSFDIFPQIVISDLFMEFIKEDQVWMLLDPYEILKKYNVKLWELWGEEFNKAYLNIYNDYFKYGNKHGLRLVKTIKAKKILIKILKTQIETGLPYICFKDTLNTYNPNKHDGYIPSFNLCTESTSNVKKNKYTHCCNLISLNLANLKYEEIEETNFLSVRILDNCIELTNPPIEEAYNHNQRYRTLGIGVLGLSDYLAKYKNNYYTGGNLISQTFEEIAFTGIKASMLLAKERGSYPAFEGSEWHQGNLLSKSFFWFVEYKNSSCDYFSEKQRTIDDWNQLRADVMSHGMRNGQLFAIAPNTSTSILQGVTASILPPLSLSFFDKNSKGTVPIYPPFIKNLKWFYIENKNFDQNKLIEIVGKRIQPWIDAGISMELLFNLNNPSIDAEYIYNSIFLAWESECKAIYYIRSIQEDLDSMLIKDCESCSN